MLPKILTQLTYPLTLCLVLVPLGLALMHWRWRRLGGGLIAFGLGWLLLWSLPVPSFWLRASLERQVAQQSAADYPDVPAIVALGGGVQGSRPGWRNGPHLSAAADRVWFAAQLYHAGRAPLVILVGGLASDEGLGEPEANAMATFIQDLGVPASALLLESRSRNTWENALYTKRLMNEHHIARVLLVTSAMHMPRAMAIFRKQGIAIIPAPTDFEATPPDGPWLLRWLPDVDALEGSSRALKEYLGLWVYRMRGMA